MKPIENDQDLKAAESIIACMLNKQLDEAEQAYLSELTAGIKQYKDDNPVAVPVDIAGLNELAAMIADRSGVVLQEQGIVTAKDRRNRILGLKLAEKELLVWRGDLSKVSIPRDVLEQSIPPEAEDWAELGITDSGRIVAFGARHFKSSVNLLSLVNASK